jgi:predicted nuclease of predicted toxin-antitoxin system
MKLWLDAQLPPLLAGWIDAQQWGIQAFAVRDVGLRDASDAAIFRAAREAGVVVMTKDRDFIRLLDEQGLRQR